MGRLQYAPCYYFTKDHDVSLAYQCWPADIACASVQAAFLPTQGTRANTVFQITFTGGSIPPGAGTAVQTGIHNTNWAGHNQSNDYSYDSTKTIYADWERVTLWHNNQLVWGVEP